MASFLRIGGSCTRSRPSLLREIQRQQGNVSGSVGRGPSLRVSLGRTGGPDGGVFRLDGALEEEEDVDLEEEGFDFGFFGLGESSTMLSALRFADLRGGMMRVSSSCLTSLAEGGSFFWGVVGVAPSASSLSRARSHSSWSTSMRTLDDANMISRNFVIEHENMPITDTFAGLGHSTKLQPARKSKIDTFSAVEAKIESGMIASGVRDYKLAFVLYNMIRFTRRFGQEGRRCKE